MRKISFVIPVYNEEENIQPLFSELAAVADGLGDPYEVLFVDDGSGDNSLGVIKSLVAEHPEVEFVSFARNAGQSAALCAGFQRVTGDVVITMDADLQNDPADIARLLSYYGEYDVVNGWRVHRQDSLSKKIASWIGNSLRNWLTGERIADTGCSLKVMNAAMLKKIKMFKGAHRFLPTLMRIEGARVIEVAVNHRSRRFGETKYTNWRRGLQGLYDVIAVRWMIKRNISVEVRESSVEQ